MRFCFALLVFLVAPHTSAQGTVAGRVTQPDAQGVVSEAIGVNVRIEGTTLGAATGIDGNYRIIGVPVGTYRLTASYVGTAPVTQAGVRVEAGQTRTLDLALPPMSAAEFTVCGGWYEAPFFPLGAYASRILIGDGVEEASSTACFPGQPTVYWGGS